MHIFHKKLMVFLFTLLISIVPHFSLAADYPAIDFFYGIGCPHCAKVEPVIDQFISDYPQITINKYEVYQNQENAIKLNQKFEEYNVPLTGRGVPVLFYQNIYALGDGPIIAFLDELSTQIISSQNAAPKQQAPLPPADENQAFPVENQTPPEPEINQQSEQTAGAETAGVNNDKLSIIAIAGAAVVDSINPCAIAVLLILLGALMLASESKKRALYGGLAFTSSIYIGYFLFGLGVTSAFHFSGLAGWLYKIIGVLAILIGLANLKDFFFYGAGGFVMEIPRSWRPKLKSFLNKITSPWGAFLAGFVVLLFELPCTGGPYFFVIGLLSQTDSLIKTIPTLLFYNLVFVLPLLIITGLIYWGKSSVEKANEWKDKNIRLLHLIGGLIMLALGIWVIFWG